MDVDHDFTDRPFSTYGLHMDVKDTALYIFLKESDELLYGKILELRNRITGWLSYIPATFPHYTRHTVEHSDEIVRQISNLLFTGDDRGKPVTSLSAVEAYILVAAALLHDAGMVCSDKEKSELLSSDEWKNWVTSGAGAERWVEIKHLRETHNDIDESVRNFLSDLETRFLIAEFVRLRHHIRSGDFLTEHEGLLGSFALNDQVLTRTIFDVCVGHGLNRSEIEDTRRYPEERDILGYKANVRFLAILLRLGDLLDMSSDRACPLLLNAACPLPSTSLAHWSQYGSITHRLTSPEVIEIDAECTTQDEHRVLQDWCQWIVDEVTFATTALNRTSRHSGWIPPRASLDGANPSIRICPKRGANYVPYLWKLELDTVAVIDRLVQSIYGSPKVFVRELIQNALDATRCRVCLEYDEIDSAEDFPYEVPENVLEKFPVVIELTETEITNEMSGKKESRQVVAVEDAGIGMDAEIIQRYLLQIGRSYYTSAEFRDRYTFNPTSRFGIGFLSVFGVSTDVTVVTAAINSEDPGFKLKLTGPRNYLLVEKVHKSNPGTRVEVTLNTPFSKGELLSLVKQWCQRVEFPIVVREFGEEFVVNAEVPAKYIGKFPDIRKEIAEFEIRMFPLQALGVRGEIYVFIYKDDSGERWDEYGRVRYSYNTLDARADLPYFPESLICINGISTADHVGFNTNSVSWRIDYRKGEYSTPLDRGHVNFHQGQQVPIEVRHRIEEILAEHLKTSKLVRGDQGWKYKQRLVEQFPVSGFWENESSMVRIHSDGKTILISLSEFFKVPRFSTISAILPFLADERLKPKDRKKVHKSEDEIAKERGGINLIRQDLLHVSNSHVESIFSRSVPRRIARLKDGIFATDFEWSDLSSNISRKEFGIHIVEFQDISICGICLNVTDYSLHKLYLLNSTHPLIVWRTTLLDMLENLKPSNKFEVSTKQTENLDELLERALWLGEIKELDQFLDGWRVSPDTPEDLRPPELSSSDFSFDKFS